MAGRQVAAGGDGAVHDATDVAREHVVCGGAFSGEAYCQARQRLPLEVLRRKKSFPYMSRPREKLRQEIVRKATTP